MTKIAYTPDLEDSKTAFSDFLKTVAALRT